MCLITEQKKIIVTRKNHIVYKLVKRLTNNQCAALLYRFNYMKDVTYNTEMKLTKTPNTFDEIVSTRYTKSWNRYVTKGKYLSDNYTCIGAGFHSTNNPERMEKDVYTNYVMAEFEIPKGAKVYRDDTGLIVSNKITFKKFL